MKQRGKYNWPPIPTYLCSLDAEGAYDQIPHAVLFDCADALPDACWRVMLNWYTNLEAKVKWNNQLCDSISISKGQGGLSSPAMFNMFYNPVVDKLNPVKSGIVFGNQCYNALCYVDDLMVMSTTVTGLQLLIDTAVKHITERGLLFNPTKTECYINGKNPFVSRPKWYIGLKITDKIKYLGVTLDIKRGLSHVELRISKANKAFYSLQSAGLYSNLSAPLTSVNVYKTAVQSGLLYGCGAIDISKANIFNLEKQQGKYT